MTLKHFFFLETGFKIHVGCALNMGVHYTWVNTEVTNVGCVFMCQTACTVVRLNMFVRYCSESSDCFLPNLAPLKEKEFHQIVLKYFSYEDCSLKL